MANKRNQLILGRRLRYFRRRRDFTLAEVGSRVGRPVPYLSLLENGKVEPKLSLLGDLAEALDTTTSELLESTAPDHRTELEIELLMAQEDPDYLELGLPYLKPTSQLGDSALEHLVGLWQALQSRVSAPQGTAVDVISEARSVNLALRAEMRSRDNYFAEIEALANRGLERAGYPGSGPISERVLTELVGSYGFAIERVTTLPRSARSITDTRDKLIFIPDRGGLRVRQARSIVLQTLGHFALEHSTTDDFGDYLRQRIESNYFAGAVLAPERPAVELLSEAKANSDISVEDLKETFYISYEMAAHRFTNLATVYLDLPVHFLRTDSEGVISKAYENDGIRFPTSADGGIEGERVPRQWAARQAWNAHGSFLLHVQYTVVDDGEFLCISYIETETDKNPYAITLGTTAEQAHYFRGSDTLRREHARSRDIEPDPALTREWEPISWPSAAERSHVLSALPRSQQSFSAFPGVDILDVYRFLERQRRHRRSHPTL